MGMGFCQTYTRASQWVPDFMGVYTPREDRPRKEGSCDGMLDPHIDWLNVALAEGLAIAWQNGQ